jgi:6-phosphogluconolactonase
MHVLVICENSEALAARAADSVIEIAQEAIAARGRFTVALCGGTTPEKTYRLLGQSSRAAAIDWSKSFVFFGDERLVPPTDRWSNYRMAQESFLAHVPIPSSQVHPVETESINAGKAAKAYELGLRDFYDTSSANPQLIWESSPPDELPLKVPIFDLILLGLGEDGHTASLFPHSAALKEDNAWVTWSKPGALPPPVERITFTYRLLNAASNVLFLVSGANKASILQKVLEENANPETYPAAGVHPDEGRMLWLVDRPAAASMAPDILKRFTIAAP